MRSLLNPDQPMRTPIGSMLFGLAKGVLPEIGSVRDELIPIGKKLEQTFARKNITPETLTPRDMVAAKRMLAGDLVGAFKARAPRGRELVLDLVEAIGSGGKTLKFGDMDATKFVNAIRSGEISQDKVIKMLEGMSHTIQNNRATGYLSRSLTRRGGEVVHPRINAAYNKLKNIPGVGLVAGPILKPLANRRTTNVLDAAIEALEPAKNPRLNNVLQNVGDAASTVTLSVADPWTGLVNAVKRGASSPYLSKPTIGNIRNPISGPGKTIQENLSDQFVSLPLEDSFNKGLQGERVTPFDLIRAHKEFSRSQNKLKLLKDYGLETGDSQIINPVTSSLKDLANGFGYAIHNAGIDVDKFKAISSGLHDMVGVPESVTPVKKTFIRRLSERRKASAARNAEHRRVVKEKIFNVLGGLRSKLTRNKQPNAIEQ